VFVDEELHEFLMKPAPVKPSENEFYPHPVRNGPYGSNNEEEKVKEFFATNQ
jgi:hypothetical protein